MRPRKFLRFAAVAILGSAAQLLAWVPHEVPGLRYPRAAQLARLEGAVLVECTISEDGTVSKAVVKSGHPALGRAAAKYAKTWRFVRSGDGHDKPTVVLTIEFRLVGDCRSQCCNENFLLIYPDRVVVTSEAPGIIGAP